MRIPDSRNLDYRCPVQRWNTAFVLAGSLAIAFIVLHRWVLVGPLGAGTILIAIRINSVTCVCGQCDVPLRREHRIEDSSQADEGRNH
jgi:hypothetical protein